MTARLPLKFAFLLSLSLAGAASFNVAAVPRFHRNYGAKNVSSLPPSTKLKATASDLLLLLGTPLQAESVNSQVAGKLRSCFKFLVPFRNNLNSGRSLNSMVSRDKVDELIVSPPASVLELARIAFDSGADPGAIHRALDPTMITVPDVEGSVDDHCELTRTPYGRKFIDQGLDSYFQFLFEVIVERGPRVGLNVSLSRYDLFHGHLFLNRESGRLGILFHAKEYPAYDKEVFPLNLGYCQVGSNVAYDDSMNLRNILWLAPLPSNSTDTDTWLSPGILVVLDAYPGGIIYQDLIPDYVKIARTLYEDDFGEVVVDVNYLNVGGEKPNFQLFIC